MTPNGLQDNLAYEIGLKESVRVRVEYAGRCHLTEVQASELWWTKVTFLATIPLGLLVPMPIIALGKQVAYGVGLFVIPFVRLCMPLPATINTAIDVLLC